MYTLIQDAGRPGHQSSGIPNSGALDKSSAAAANWCVGNPASAPVLEITMIGPQIRFEGACQIAVTGAEIAPKVEGVAVHRYETVNMPSGAVLSFGKLQSGCRAYLAVRGEWQVQRWLDSASALSVGNVDLVPGSIIRKDSALNVLAPDQLSTVLQYPNPVASWPDELTVQVLPGPEFHSFSAQQIAFFFNTRFTLSGESNRIGYRLEPVLPDYTSGQEFISSGIIPGTVQITHIGQPIIMMSDAQTTGGYPRIANVLSKDIDALAQLRPGNTVHFLITHP